jgi:hypothetical protein
MSTPSQRCNHTRHIERGPVLNQRRDACTTASRSRRAYVATATAITTMAGFATWSTHLIAEALKARETYGNVQRLDSGPDDGDDTGFGLDDGDDPGGGPDPRQVLAERVALIYSGGRVEISHSAWERLSAEIENTITTQEAYELLSQPDTDPTIVELVQATNKFATISRIPGTNLVLG